MTMPVQPNVGIGDTASSTPTTGTASLLAPDTFLNLLVDELKYQDPLNPTNSSDFMNQIAQLSQVEQLQSVTSASQISEASTLIGRSITGVDAAGASVTSRWIPALPRMELLGAACASLVAIYLLLGVVNVINNYLTISIGQRMVNDLRARLFEHLQRSFSHTVNNLGPHGLPLIGRADWNDCLNLNCFSDDPDESFQTTGNRTGRTAESLMIAGQFVLYGREFAALCKRLGMAGEAAAAL